MRHRRFAFAAAAGVAMLAGGAVRAQLPTLDLDTVQSGFSRPLALIQDPQDRSVQFVVQQRGRIRVIKDGALLPDFMDLTSLVNQTTNEGGLLGLAFPPDPNDDRFYVNYTTTSGTASRVVRYQRDPNDPLKGDPSSAELLLTLGQPFTNHNGGNMAFGPLDGYLYIGFGDGGSAGDPGHRAQNPDTLLGKLLRIDVSPAEGYAIPPDNPFLDGDPIEALDEIWDFGLRNPWRWSFDNPAHGGTGALLIADVGQNAWEEINFEQPLQGEQNYGWRNREGAHNFNNTLPPAYEPLVDPIFEYSHSIGQSITGGYVYRGTKLGSPYRGRYFYGDFITRRVWSFELDQTGSGAASNNVEHTGDLGGSAFIGNVASFGEDADGELYIISFNGTVRKIVPTEETTIKSVEMIFGAQATGGLAELSESDDQFYEVDSQFGFSALEPNITEIQVRAITGATSPSLIDVVVEARLNNSGGMGEIRLFNFNQSVFRTKGTHNIGLDEEVFRFENLSNPDRFVSASGEIRMRSKHVVIATFSAEGFTSFYDWICIVARR